MIEGAAILLAGIVIGRFMRVRQRPKEPKPLQPICGCGHHLSYHADSKACSAEDSKWDIDRGTWYKPCTCKRFVLQNDTMAALGLTNEDFKP